MNGTRAVSGGAWNGTWNLSLQNKRLKEIREDYERHKQTPQQRRDDEKESRNEMYEIMRRGGASEAAIARFKQDLAAVDAAIANAPDEDPYDKIVSETFTYNDGNRVTITSEGSRHWRNATVQDTGSIVYIPMKNKFGKFADTDYESDEEFPEEKHTTAIVYTFSGGKETPRAWDDKFDEILVVPDEVFNGVRNEAPPGRFFSGHSKNGNGWSPAPEGKVWLKHPFIKEPNGMYLNDCSYFIIKKRIECAGIRPEIIEKVWWERGTLAYWCPVLQRFITEGERYRLQHWFHNGNGSAQERYYYDQNEMLDLHGGLGKLPTTVSLSKKDEEVSFVGVMKVEDLIANRRKKAEADGEVIEIDQDQKMPAKKQRTK